MPTRRIRKNGDNPGLSPRRGRIGADDPYRRIVLDPEAVALADWARRTRDELAELDEEFGGGWPA